MRLSLRKAARSAPEPPNCTGNPGKRVISVETLSQSARALLPPHKCGGSHRSFRGINTGAPTTRLDNPDSHNASAGHGRRLLKKGHSSLEKTTKSLCAILSNCKYR